MASKNNEGISMQKEILRISHLYKKIGDKEILNDFSMNLYEGEILGIMGLKGSGKSLLFHILNGEEEFDQGTLFFDENRLYGKKISLRNQIAVLGKESGLQKNMSVVDNIFHIRKHYHHQFWVHDRKFRERTQNELEELGVNIAPDTLVCNLSGIESYMLEIIKSWIIGAKVIILDDFTDKYSTQEILQLNQLLNQLKNKGVSFIIAGYQLQNMQMCAERIVFLVNGTAVKSIPNKNRNQINENIIFQIFPSSVSRKESNRKNEKKPIFISENICTEKLTDISFELYKGEILTLVDFENINNLNLLECLLNPNSLQKGSFSYNGHPVREGDYAIKNSGILYVDFNLNNKIIEQMSLADNLCLGNYHKISRVGFYNRKSMDFIKRDFLEHYPNEALEKCKDCTHLSEKDKMAILLYRIKLSKPQMIICMDPRRYADVLTYEMIKEQLWELAENGTAVLLLVQNIEQNYTLADRFLFWRKGKITEFPLKELVEN